MKAIFALALVAALSGCQNSVENPELNQCAQQNFQCETNCSNSTVEESMTNTVRGPVPEIYNRCKEQAEKLGEIQ